MNNLSIVAWDKMRKTYGTGVWATAPIVSASSAATRLKRILNLKCRDEKNQNERDEVTAKERPTSMNVKNRTRTVEKSSKRARDCKDDRESVIWGDSPAVYETRGGSRFATPGGSRWGEAPSQQHRSAGRFKIATRLEQEIDHDWQINSRILLLMSLRVHVERSWGPALGLLSHLYNKPVHEPTSLPARSLSRRGEVVKPWRSRLAMACGPCFVSRGLGQA
jgi:hypothetical protein